MDLEARVSTQNSLLDIHSKKFLLISALIHLFLLIFFLKKSPIEPLTNTKTIIRFKSESKSSQIKSNRKGQSTIRNFAEDSPSNNGSTSKNSINLPQQSSKLTSELTFETNYPRLSRILKEEGEVIFKVTNNNTQGRQSFEIHKSSGFERLDLAAEEALHKNTDDIVHLIQEKQIKQIRFEFKLSKK